MIRERSMRWRMVVLFCLTAGALLGVCYAGFYFIFQRVVRDQFDRRLSEIAAPIIVDIAGDPRGSRCRLSSISRMSTSRSSTLPAPFCSAPEI